jgi:hypothetical protein
VRKIHYEFECEALADFKYGIDKEKSNVEANKDLINNFKDSIINSLSE